MLNTYNSSNHSSNIKINAVSGAILKNHPKSWFKRFHLTSGYADMLFKEGGHKFDKWSDRDKYEKYGGITILQMVICGDMEVIAELVYTKDFEAYKGGEDDA